MAAARYFDLVREMKESIYNHRLRLVESAQQRGIKPTARLFSTTVPTVRKWLRRFQQQGPSGLLARSRARHHQSLQTPSATEARLVELRKTLPTFGARRLIREFDLPISHGALERIWRQHRLLNKRRRKYQRKQDLAHIKASWALFQQISADTKDLDDIPRYWLQAQHLGLPVVQYTARDVRSGLLFWSFAQRRSAAASAVFASRIQQHLDRYGVSLRDLVWQTDNGGEFKGDFPKALGDSQHVRIPPAAHTYQSDVETVHRLEEDEFFDLEDFSSRGDFLAKVHTYQLYFNLVRLNSHKQYQSPWQIIQRLSPRSPLQLCLLPPVFLDYHLNHSGGYHVPRLPYHYDHSANANEFAASTWLVQRPERLLMFAGPPASGPDNSAARFSKLKDSKTVILDGDHDVFGDGTVVIISTPGHTPGHQSLLVKLANTGPVLLSEDLYHYPSERTLKNFTPFASLGDPAKEAISKAKVERLLKTTGATLWIQHDITANARLKKSPAYYD